MSNFKNYILKAQGETANIDISGFINENFGKYIAKFAGYVFNEDINYRVSDSGNINIEYDSANEQTVSETISGISTIENLYDHLKSFYSIGKEGFKLNGTAITSPQTFSSKINEIKEKQITYVKDLDISPTPFFHITSIGIDNETKKRFNDFFIKTTRLHEYIFTKDNVNKMNEIITETFNKEKENGNKFFFHRVGLDSPVTFKEFKKSADNACANLATSVFFDDNNKNKIVNILNLIIEEMGKKINIIENKKDKAQNDKQKIRDLNTEIEIITEFKKDLSKEIKKGILEIKLTKNTLTLTNN